MLSEAWLWLAMLKLLFSEGDGGNVLEKIEAEREKALESLAMLLLWW